MRLFAIALLVLIARVEPARAFSDPLSFGDGVQLGGGGGRYFTGSAADGFGCDVCHSGAEPPAIEVLGLPVRGFAPGASYEISVVWPEAIEHLGLALEITDAHGAAAGQIRLPPAHELPEPERCEPVEDGAAAGVLHEAPGRAILQVPDCGARRLRFLWTAPEEPPDVVLFSGGFVASDGQADVDRDGVTMFSRPVTQSGETPVMSLRGSCSTAAAGRHSSGPVLLVVLAALLVGRRGRGRAHGFSRSE